MLLPGESAEEMQRSETIEELLKPWVRPDEVELIRASVYRFHSLMATSWRDRRVFLAGDAAHQTPPFLGQGLCHGIRDVHNLITKIVAVTAGGPPEELLASYQAERQPHVQQIIDMAVAAGREICLLDPGLAEERDRLMRAAAAAGTLPPTTFQGMPPLSHGLLSQTAGAGEQFPQPVTRLPDGRAGRFDDVIAPDVVVVAYDDGIASLRRATHAMGVPLVALHQAAADSGDLPFVTSTVVDEWFERHGARVAVLRPDRYVYGTAEDIDQAGDLIRNARALFPLP
jgi:3-(3-hydroxy-phenyl)propionate hydroxylase